MARFGHIVRRVVGIPAIVVLSSCYDDLDLDPSKHPCAACKPCERCVSGELGPHCEVEQLHAAIRCDESGSLRRWFDSCGAPVELVERCPPNAECVETADNGAACRCRNQWQGSLCDVCPEHFDTSTDCSGCLNAYEGDNCEICPSNWDAAQSCAVCAGHWQDTSCDVCPPNWDPSKNCSECSGNWDPASECTACRSGYVDAGDDCGSCQMGPTWDPSKNCAECLGNWDLASNCTSCSGHWQGSSCDVCPSNWDPTKSCAECTGHRDPTLDCSACLNGYVDQGNDCGTCAAGWEPNALTGLCEEVCGNRIVTLSESCDDGNSEPFDGCDSCAIAPFFIGRAEYYVDPPDISSASSGRFVIVWDDGNYPDQIWARTFEANGMAMGAPFLVASSGGARRTAPQVVMADDERSTASWLESVPAAAARRFDVNGVPAGDAFVVNDAADAPRRRPSIAGTADGRFALAWPGTNFIAAKLFGADAVASATYRFTQTCDAPVPVSMNGAGRLVVACVNSNNSLTFTFDDSRSLYANPAQSNTNPSLAATGSGSWIAVWHSFDFSANSSLHALPFSINTPVGNYDEFQLEPDGDYPDVVVLPSGDFAVAYSYNGIHVNIYASDGTARFSPVRVATYPVSRPAIAATPSSGVIVAWAADGTLLAQRFSADLKPLGLAP